MEINKTTIQAFRNDFKTAVAQLEQQYGVRIELGNARYTSDHFTSKLTVSLVSSTGEVKSPLAENLEVYRNIYNIPAEFTAGCKFSHRGSIYTLKGIDTKKRKYPVIVEQNGKTYKVSASIFNVARVI